MQFNICQQLLVVTNRTVAGATVFRKLLEWHSICTNDTVFELEILQINSLNQAAGVASCQFIEWNYFIKSADCLNTCL